MCLLIPHYEFDKNANSINVGTTVLVILISLATIGVCVFCAVTSVAALFIFGEVQKMRKTTQKLLSLLLAMAMILSVFSGVTFGSSISAQAAENPLPPEETLLGDRHEDSQLNYGAFVSGDYSYEILPDGTCAITGYNGNETNLTIPSVIDGYSVTKIDGAAFCDEFSLTGIIIPEGVTSIGDWAFSGCGGLTEIILPDSITTIGDGVFRSCNSLTEVIIPNSVISIGVRAFGECYSLTEMMIPEGVISIGAGAFSCCESLNKITISESVISIGSSVFEGCINLEEITIHPDNPAYTSDGSVLFSKDMQVLIAAPTVTGTYIIPDGVTTIGDSAFCNSNLREIIFPDSVTSIEGWAFDRCQGLTEVILPNGVTSIGHWAFARCYNLTKVAIPDSVISVGSCVFEECDNLEYYVYDNAMYLGNEENPYALLTGVVDSSAESIHIPEGVITIGNSAFDGCNGLNEVILPNSITSIGDFAFYCCDSLTNIILPNSITLIGEDAFAACSNLTEISIPSGVTGIGAGAFEGCYNLKNLEVHPDNSAYTSVNSVLFSKDMQVLVAAPSVSGNYTVPNGVTTIGDRAFDGCRRLHRIVLPNSVTTIGYRAFTNSLSSITFLGDAPQFDDEIFNGTVTAYYPAGNSTWTEDKLQDYGGFVTWETNTKLEVRVIFRDWDETLLDIQYVPYGQMPVAPADPIRNSDSEQYHYRFIGWDHELVVVTEDMVYTAIYELITVPTLTLKSPTLEFKDMITVNAMFTAENIEDVVEMGMITYTEKVDEWSVETAAHVIPGTSYDATTGRYIAHSQGINAKYLGDTVYLACYAKLTDGSYVYTKLAPYSPVQYATNQLKNSTDTKLKQLVAAMLNYGAEAQLFFGHNTDAPANATLTDEQKLLPEAYRADMVASVPAVDAAKQGIFANNKGFSKRYPTISFEGAFCINYFFKPNYAPVGDITLYYWNEAEFEAASVLTKENASGTLTLALEDSGEYRGDIEGIAAKNLSEAVYVAAVYSDGTTEWTSGVLGYSIGAYCSSQSSKGAAVAALAEATAVYGYHAKQFFT